MATSSHGSGDVGLWDTAAGRFIASPKNLLGSALAAGAVVAQLVVGLGPLWPLIVVAGYAIGALVAPRERVDLRLGLERGLTADELTDQLRRLRRSVRGEARRLPDDASAKVTGILDALDEIVPRFDELAARPDQRHVVEQMLADYLPTSIQRYVNLPRTFALGARVAGMRTAHDELMDQLGILADESDRIRTAVYARDVEALSDQSRFLRDKFARSELDLP